MDTPWIGPHGERIRRLEFHITYHCPERCVFCSEDHRMQAYHPFPVTFGRIATVLRTHAARGVEHVHFTGGEPTIHPRFLEILQLARKLGMRTSIGTIGTRLSDPAFAQAVLPYLDEALFSVHGADAATHDAVTGRAGSFERVTRAIAHAREKPGFGLYINTVVTTHNLAALPRITAFAREQGATLQVLSNLTPEGAGEDHYDPLTVRLLALSAQVPAVVAAAGPMVVRFFGVPLCVLGAYWRYSNDLYWNPRVTVEWAAQPGKVVLDDIYSWNPGRKRTPVGACERCVYRQVCFGVFAAYAERYGEDELRAVEAT